MAYLRLSDTTLHVWNVMLNVLSLADCCSLVVALVFQAYMHCYMELLFTFRTT